MLSSMPYIHFPAPSDAGRWPGSPQRLGNPRASVSKTQIPGENHSQPDHHMLTPPLFIHLPRRRLKNPDQNPDDRPGIKKSANPPDRRAADPHARMCAGTIMPDQHPPGRRQQPVRRHTPRRRTHPARSQVSLRASEIAAGCRHHAATPPSRSKAVRV